MSATPSPSPFSSSSYSSSRNSGSSGDAALSFAPEPSLLPCSALQLGARARHVRFVRLSSKGEEKQETHLARRRIISSSSGPTRCLAGFGCIAPRGTQAADEIILS